MYYSTNVLRDTTHKAYINFNMLRYPGAILRKKIHIYKPTCQYMCIYYPKLTGWSVYICCNNSLRMTPRCRNM